MTKFVPFHDYVLVEMLSNESSDAGIVYVTSDPKYAKVRVVDKSHTVPLHITCGDIVLVDPHGLIDISEALCCSHSRQFVVHATSIIGTMIS